jgi:hypothetical protein
VERAEIKALRLGDKPQDGVARVGEDEQRGLNQFGGSVARQVVLHLEAGHAVVVAAERPRRESTESRAVGSVSTTTDPYSACFGSISTATPLPSTSTQSRS